VTPVSRVVACQGSIQLVTALAAAAADRRARPTRDYLVIHDLSCPDGQVDDFARQIRAAAEALHPWQRILFLDRTTNADSAAQIAALKSGIGTSDVAELLLNRFPTPGSRLLRRCYPAARRIDCGDGIGVHYTPGYFLHEPPSADARLLGRLKGGVKVLARRARNEMYRSAARRYLSPSWSSKVGADDRFDESRYLLPGLFDERPLVHRRTNPATYRALFARLGRLLADSKAPSLTELTEVARTADRVVLLLSTNFSELGRMSRADELRGYHRMLTRAGCGPGAAIVIKPHPRDSIEKIERLKELAADLGAVTVALTDPITFYLPFEAVFQHYLAGNARLTGRSVAICFSTACLSLEYLFRVPCVVGFGPEFADCFAPRFRSPRVRHEADLNRAIGLIRAGTFGAAGG
jgi:hypothetical protein